MKPTLSLLALLFLAIILVRSHPDRQTSEPASLLKPMVTAGIAYAQEEEAAPMTWEDRWYNVGKGIVIILLMLVWIAIVKRIGRRMKDKVVTKIEQDS